MDVEEYLQHVRQEEATLPAVHITESANTLVSTSGKTARRFQHLIKIDDESSCLDTGFRLTEREMRYFRNSKAVINAQMAQTISHEKCSLLKHCMWLMFPTEHISPMASSFQKLDDACWPKLFNSEPPDTLRLCALGISFATVHIILHRLAGFLCEGKGKNITEKSSKWLFAILLVLDELHAMLESVSYELQRIKRAVARRLQAINEVATDRERADSQGGETCEQIQRNIACCTLNLCIIQQYFHQR